MSNADDESPDFTRGVALADIPDGGMIAGHVGGTPALLARRGTQLFAVGATCTHLGGPLTEGLLVTGTVRCPWHHACFSLHSGEALTAPAFDPLPCWTVRVENDRAIVGEPLAAPAVRRSARAAGPVVIVGGGAAGFAAANLLLREGFRGGISLVSDDTEPPYDRTLLTKDYLDGRFGDAHLPLAHRDLAAVPDLQLLLGTRAQHLDTASRRLELSDGTRLSYDKLLLATGAAPKRADFPGADLPHVKVLRSLADCRAILRHVKEGQRVVVLGGSFIGLEAAAALRDRHCEVAVVSPERQPMAKIFGPELAAVIAATHRAHGVVWHLGRRIAEVSDGATTLDDGTDLAADLVVVGIGVEPRTGLAEAAGLAVDDGVVVDSYLAASAPGVFAAGDIARWPDRYSGEQIRVEHWAVAERQGQIAALNIMGHRQHYAAVPFFWTKQFDLSIRYVGHAADWDEILVEGDLAARDAAVRFVKDGRLLAVATVERDLEALREERAWELAGGRRTA